MQAECAEEEANASAAQGKAMQLQAEVAELHEQAQRKEETLRQTVARAVARTTNLVRENERLEGAFVNEARRAAVAETSGLPLR